MSNSKFLSEAQKCESIDTRERLKQTKAREKLKRKKDADGDSVTNLNRTQKDKNSSSKKQKQNQTTTSSGQARICELCKAAGAPEFVYKTHNASHCRKKEDHIKALSGSAASRQKVTREYKSHEKQIRREYKMLKKLNVLRAKKRKSKKDEDVDMSSVSSGDDSVNY